MSKPLIYTIGQGARTIDEFLALLKSNTIQYLIDVRTFPYSKFRPEFNKEAITRSVTGVHIHYLYMGDTLGGKPKESGMLSDGKFDYTMMASVPSFQEGLNRLVRAHDIGAVVAVMCSEGKPEECHRSKLIGECLDRKGIPVIHIDEDGVNRTHSEIINRITGGQLDIFGQSFTSRKKFRSNDSGDNNAQ